MSNLPTSQDDSDDDSAISLSQLYTNHGRKVDELRSLLDGLGKGSLEDECEQWVRSILASVIAPSPSVNEGSDCKVSVNSD